MRSLRSKRLPYMTTAGVPFCNSSEDVRRTEMLVARLVTEPRSNLNCGCVEACSKVAIDRLNLRQCNMRAVFQVVYKYEIESHTVEVDYGRVKVSAYILAALLMRCSRDKVRSIRSLVDYADLLRHAPVGDGARGLCLFVGEIAVRRWQYLVPTARRLGAQPLRARRVYRRLDCRPFQAVNHPERCLANVNHRFIVFSSIPFCLGHFFSWDERVLYSSVFKTCFENNPSAAYRTNHGKLVYRSTSARLHKRTCTEDAGHFLLTKLLSRAGSMCATQLLPSFAFNLHWNIVIRGVVDGRRSESASASDITASQSKCTSLPQEMAGFVYENNSLRERALYLRQSGRQWRPPPTCYSIGWAVSILNGWRRRRIRFRRALFSIPPGAANFVTPPVK